MLLEGEDPDGARVYFSKLEGWFSFDHPSAAGTWFAGPLLPDLTLRATRSAAGAREVWLQGGVMGFTGPYEAAYTPDLRASEAGCAAEPELRASSKRSRAVM